MRTCPPDLTTHYFFGSLHHLGTWYRPDGEIPSRRLAEHYADSADPFGMASVVISAQGTMTATISATHAGLSLPSISIDDLGHELLARARCR